MIEQFWNICLLHDISTRDQLLREAIRVILTRQSLELDSSVDNNLENKPEKLFQWMKEHGSERELGHFPGDRELFHRLYHIGKNMDLMNYALQTIQQDRVIGGIIAHTGIMIDFLEMCEHHSYEDLLIAEAEKFIRGIIETKCYKKSYRLTLLTESYMMAKLFRTYFAAFPEVSVVQGTIYQPLPLEQKYDAILAIPNFGMKIDEEEDIPIRDSEGIAVYHLLPLMQENGKINVTLPARMLFQSGSVANWRKQMNELASVTAISVLPDGLFRPFTSVKTYRVVLGTQAPEEVKLARLQLAGVQLVSEQEIKVHPDQFRLLQDWRIELLLNEDQATLHGFQQVGIPKVKLGEVADIFRGKSIMKQDLKPGKISVLNISNIEDGEVRLDQLETIDEEERKVKRYEILPGDLVMTCRGTVTKLAVFPPYDHLVIASANIIVIRFKSTIQSHYAQIFLESPTGSALIQSFQRGTTVMNLNPADVAEIEMPLRMEEEQFERIQSYMHEKERYKAAIHEATTRWEQVKHKLYSELY